MTRFPARPEQRGAVVPRAAQTATKQSGMPPNPLSPAQEVGQ